MAAGPRDAEVIVLGAGLVGLACAHQLRQRGRDVLLVDRAGAGSATSFGNAGSISVGNVLPHATPGILRKAARMLLDPLAPLKLDQPQRPGYWRWLWDFVRSGDASRVTPIIDALHAINHASRRAWIDWCDAIGAADLLAHSGYLQVFEHEANFAKAEYERAQMQRLGVDFDVLDRAAIEDLEPRIGPAFRHASFQPQALAMRDPGAFCQRAAADLAQRGVALSQQAIERIEPHDDGYRLQGSDGELHCRQLVICAGAWSVRLLAQFGLRLPIVPARGYHLMFDVAPAPVQRPTLWSERYMVVSPMRGGVRMTSIKELTRLDSAPRYRLIERLRPELARLFAPLDRAPVSQWHGFRPCTPDSLPILDRLPGERIFIAAGHGHLGLTQSAISGELIAALVSGETPALDVRPYRAGRFGRD